MSQPQTWFETVIRYNGKPIPVQVINRTDDVSKVDVGSGSEAATIPVGAPFDYMVRSYYRPTPRPGTLSKAKTEMQIVKSCKARIVSVDKIDESVIRLNLELR